MVVLCLGFASSIEAAGSEASAGLEPGKVVLQLRWYHQFQFAGYYAALEKGYYREAGLEVDILQRDKGQDPLEEVLSGRAQFGATNSEVLLHALKGKPLVVLAAIFQHSPLVFVSRKEKGIVTPHDLIGRNVVLGRDTRNVELHAMLRNEGVSLDQLRLFRGKGTGEDYFDPEMDALPAYITNQPFLWRQLGIEYAVMRPNTYGIDFYGDCLFTSSDMVKQRPETVRSFVRASLKGWDYAMRNPVEISKLIITKYGTEKTLPHLEFEAERMRELMLPRLVEIGHMNPGRWRHIAQIFSKLGMVAPESASPEFFERFIYDPSPRADTRGLYTMLWVLGAACLAAGAAAAVMLRFTRKLQREVGKRKKAEEELARSRSMLETVIEQSPVGIMTAEAPDCRIRIVNSEAVRIFGQTKELQQTLNMNNQEMLNWEMLYPDGRIWPLEDAPLPRAVLKGGHAHNEEMLVRRADGGESSILCNGAPLKNEAGEIQGGVITFVDVTERKRAREELEKTRALLVEAINQSPLGVIIADALDVTIRMANMAAFHIRGGGDDDESLVGVSFVDHSRNWKIYLPDRNPFPPEELPLTRAVLNGEISKDVEFIIQDINGNDHWVVANAAPIRDGDGRITAGVAVFHDITRRKQDEEKLAQINRDLEKMVRERTWELARKAMELEQANARLQELDMLKSALLSSVSHELRTPLTSIYGFTKIILNDFTRHFSPLIKKNEVLIERGRRIEDNLKVISEEGARLTRLINDVLDLSKIESGSMQWNDEAVDVGRAVKRACDAVSGQLALKPEISLEMEVENNTPAIRIDPDRLSQVLINLLSNAIKFTEKGVVSIKSKRVENNLLRIEVSDSGQGIPIEDQKRIFDKFYQGGPNEEKAKGTGLGLAICREIALHYNGSIGVESSQGQGAVFYFDLPC